MEKRVEFVFRWPVKQTGPAQVEVLIPLGTGAPVLNAEFVEQHKLSEGEYEKAETAVLRSIAVIS